MLIINLSDSGYINAFQCNRQTKTTLSTTDIIKDGPIRVYNYEFQLLITVNLDKETPIYTNKSGWVIDISKGCS